MGKRRPLIAGNWKMNGLKKDGLARVKGLANKVTSLNQTKIDVIICPPFTMLAAASQTLKGSKVKLGAQDCHFLDSGAHTGDISASMIKDAGCKFVIVGHSERRINHGERDDTIRRKAEAAISCGLTVIICIGETLNQRKANKTRAVCRHQLLRSLPKGATSKNTIIAYEPIWAIGTGKTATPEEAQTVHRAVREQFRKKLGEAEATRIRIIYGGSMKPENARLIMQEPDIDGGLIGGASLMLADFCSIIKACSPT